MSFTAMLDSRSCRRATERKGAISVLAFVVSLANDRLCKNYIKMFNICLVNKEKDVISFVVSGRARERRRA